MVKNIGVKHKLAVIPVFLAVMYAMTGIAAAVDISIHDAIPKATTDAGDPLHVPPGTTTVFSIHLNNTVNVNDLFNITQFKISGGSPLATIALNYSPPGPVLPGSPFGFLKNGIDGAFLFEAGFVSPDAISITVPLNATNGSVYALQVGVASLNRTDTASATRTVLVFIPPANISGYKINDTNGNGVWDPGEVGIAGWNITLLNGTTSAFISSTLTDGNGFYQFTNLPNGTYIVSEETQAGWVHTNATSKSVSLSGVDITNLNFTNVKLLNISGYKINDTDGNGVWDPGEMGIPGWNITLSNATMTQTTMTDANGFYMFTNLMPGSYTLTEENRAGWTPTNASSKSITLAGGDLTNLNFTNIQSVCPTVPGMPGSISGCKFNDINGNGKRDPGEPGLPGWTIRLSGYDTVSRSSIFTTTVTDINGFYQFTNVSPGFYTVCENSKPGWKPTTMPCRFVILPNQSSSAVVDFGNKVTPSRI